MITVDDVMAWYPCDEYPRERIVELFAGRETVTAQDVLDMSIPDADKLWAVLRPQMIDERTLHLLGCAFAERVLPFFECLYPDDLRPRTAIDTKRRWVAGEATYLELTEARDAVTSPPWNAARDYSVSFTAQAVWHAASIPPWDGPWDATWSHVEHAAHVARYAAKAAYWWDAAEDAAQYAAQYAEEAAQIELIRAAIGTAGESDG